MDRIKFVQNNLQTIIEDFYGKKIVLTYEKLLELAKKNPVYKDFLQYIDVLVDGPFIEQEKNLNLLFRGSNNQRLIDIPKTLTSGNIVLFDEAKYFGEEKVSKKPMYV